MINTIDKAIDEATHSSATLKDADLMEILSTIDTLDVARDFWASKNLEVTDKLTDKINEYCKRLADILELDETPSVVNKGDTL